MTNDLHANEHSDIIEPIQVNDDTRYHKRHKVGMDAIVLVSITTGISILEVPFVLTGTSGFFLLFHVLAELFSISILVGVFIIGWNTRKLASNSFFLVLGTSSLFVAIIDLFHTLAYKGMNLFTSYIPDTNLPTQLWIAARYFQAITILYAFLVVRIKIDHRKLMIILVACCAFVLAAIFTGFFPMAHDGNVLTPFKIASEYVIIGICGGATLVLVKNKQYFDKVTYHLAIALLVCLCLSEAMFTLYTDVFGLFNMVGHVFKIIVAAIIYKAIIQVSLQRPMDSLFKAIVDKEAKLEAANATLSSINALLEDEIVERTKAQNSLSEFLSMVSHELRSPLTVLSQSIQNLYQYGEKMDQEQKKNLVDGIKRNISAMGELIADISTISRMDEKRFVLTMEQFNFEDALKDVLNALAVAIKNNNAELIVDVEKDMMIIADKKRIEQVIKILLDNALKYSSDHPRITLKASLFDEDSDKLGDLDKIKITVSDNGIGIDETFLPKVFERFARSEQTKYVPGTGLGLCIAREILDLHAGTIAVTSKAGAGTEVTVVLPIHPKIE